MSDNDVPRRTVWLLAIVSASLLFLTGPIVNAWPLAFVAIVPLFGIASGSVSDQTGGTFRFKLAVYVAFFGYYLVSLQGLRHSHPLMFLPLIAMAAYLAVYPLLFVVLLRRVGTRFGGATFVYAASLWVGGEWVRNYLATGISVLMLGHSLVDMPGGSLIQIADLGGTYAVSFLIMIVNAAIADVVMSRRGSSSVSVERQYRWSVPVAVLCLIGAFFYGNFRSGQPVSPSDTTILLIGRDEQTEYQQTRAREQEIFQHYVAGTLAAIEQSDVRIDAVVWPESMLSGGQAWLIAEHDFVVPDPGPGEKSQFSKSEFRQLIEQSEDDFQRRNRNLQRLLATSNDSSPPAIIGGCGIVRYGEVPRQYSGVVLVDPTGSVAATYAKNHLVMFGEYIPLIQSIPFLRSYVPPGLGLDVGDGPEVFSVGSLKLIPNLCIETAVERISVDHLRQVNDADAIVTLTNDAWFDHSAVVDHHLRCARMVAIGCRRPILSAANGGPTAWIDSTGRIVEKLSYNEPGYISATPSIDSRRSLYVRLGAWPMSITAVVFLISLFFALSAWKTNRTADVPS